MISYCVLLCFLTSAAAIQAMLELIEQVNGTDVVNSHVRVRKINRTTAALYGNSTIKTDLGNDYEMVVTMDHSTLGNNQFNRYPMKIGPMGWCNFTRTFWHDYYPYGSKYVTNLWKPDECPVRASQQFYNDLILDGSIFPPYLPPGLWRFETTLLKEGVVVVDFRLLVKVFENGYFG